MDNVLAASPGPKVGRHPLPSAEAFAQSLGSLGIGENDIVIAYDGSGGRFAGRLVWMLRVLGQDASLLDGGLQAWLDQVPSVPLATTPVDWEPCHRQVRPWPTDAIVTADEVALAIDDGRLLVDARAPDRYRGDIEPLDPKAGHIPRAKNLFFGDNYQNRGNYFKSPSELLQRFQAAGFDEDTICYCGSGVTACNNVLAAEAAGLPRPRVFVASWSGWCSDEQRAIATGDES